MEDNQYKVTRTATSIELVVDKSHLERGPWDDEPDRVEWRSHGLPCVISRSTIGHLCGYVGVPDTHPLHGKGYDDVGDDVEVHGGLTYAQNCQSAGSVCHIPAPGEPDHMWWFGFDCAHWGDVGPDALDMIERAPHVFGYRNKTKHGATYKDVAFVRTETERLAAQLAEMR